MEQQIGVVFMGVVVRHEFVSVPMTGPMGVLHRHLSISCYENVIFNLYYFIAVPIGKNCTTSLMGFSNRILYILFYFITDFIFLL